ncbi:MAG: hypothetical protein HS130_10250 [Deltaproteobacteria bacterium]|nr:hypothetical protein [Deltaproteobacteria bacterium]MCL4873696.1 hypothetical protein [bacterium]
MKIPFKRLLKNITGISTPVFGIQWNPTKSERDIARQLITFLEDRRALYKDYDYEMPSYVNSSIHEIRRKLTELLESIDSDQELHTHMKAMRAACRKFFDKVQNNSFHRYDNYDYFAALGELRAIFGIQIAQLSVKYGINIEKDLASILPIPDEK